MGLRRSIRITKVDLSDLVRQAGGDTNELETLFMNLEGFAKIRNEKQRIAAETAADAQIAAAQEQQAAVKLLRFGSEYSNLMATESNWMRPFRDKDGNIVLENPFTLRDARVAARAAHKSIAQQAQGDEDDSNLDIFEDDDERT